MSRGINSVNISGNVGEKIDFGSTSKGDPCCSFILASEQKGARTTFVRINVFEHGLVEICRRKLGKGVYAVVSGELMSRPVRDIGDVLEVRCEEVVFV